MISLASLTPNSSTGLYSYSSIRLGGDLAEQGLLLVGELGLGSGALGDLAQLLLLLKESAGARTAAVLELLNERLALPADLLGQVAQHTELAVRLDLQALCVFFLA